METINIYQKPSCSKCRETIKLLDTKGVPFQAINYFFEPIDRETLSVLLGKLGIRPIELFRKKEERFRELGIATRALTDEALIDILVEYPELIERPIVVRGDRAIVARPPERILELF
jgi:arsenate reductase